MFKDISKTSDIDYENDFKVVIGSNTVDGGQTRVHQLKSLDSFSRSSESLALTVTSIGSKPKLEKERRKKKTRSVSRGKKDERENACDYGVSRDSGESFISGILANVRREGWSVMGESEEERLRLMNMRLEAKLSVTNQSSEDALREQAQLRCNLELAEEEVKGFSERLESMEMEQRKWSNDKESLRDHNIELDKRIAILLSDVETKVRDSEQMKNQIEMLRNTITMYEEDMVSIKDDVAMKDTVIGDLKKKMTALYSQLQLSNLYRENSEYQAEQVRLELEMAKNARAWVDEQLHTVEEVRDQLQAEVQRVRRSLDENKSERDTLEHRNQSLEVRLAKLQDARLHDTTQLLFELEQLQKEIIVSGEEKESLEEQYNTMTGLYDEKIRELERERLRYLDLEKQYEELFFEFSDIKNKLSCSLSDLDSLNVETNDLRKKVVGLEVLLSTKVSEIEALEMENEALNRSLCEWRTKSDEKDSQISELCEDMTNIRNSLDRVSSERDQSTTFISQLRDDCEKVAEQFEISRQALITKESALQLMEDMNEEMRVQLEQDRSEIESRNKLIDGLRSQKEEITNTFTELQANHLEVCQELDNLRRSLADAHLKMEGMEEEIANLVTSKEHLLEDNGYSEAQLARLKTDLVEAQQQIEDLSVVQEEYSELLDRHRQIEAQLSELSQEHQSLKINFDWTTKNLEARLEERDSELAKIIAQKDEAEQVYQRDYQTMERSHSQLRDSLESTKFAHVVELATRETQYREKLEQSEREFSQMCQEKIRCESAIGSLQEHINQLVDDYNQRLKECRAKMLSLEEKSTAYEDYELKSRQLLEELARKKGEIEGMLEEWKKVKMRAGVLETALAKKEARFLEMTNKHRTVVEKKEAVISELRGELKKERDYVAMECAAKMALQKQLESQANAIDSLARQVKMSEHRVASVELELGRCKTSEQTSMDENQILRDNEEQLRRELDRMCDENRQLMRQNQRLSEEIEKANISLEANKSTMTMLRMDAEERSRHVDEVNKKQIELVQRCKTEKRDMKGTIKDVLQEKESLTRTAELLQQREILAASVLSRVRSEVKRILFDEEMSKKRCDLSGKLSGDLCQELYKLLDETEVPIKTTKPLSRLSKCIDDLRTQIDCIQDEVSKQYIDDPTMIAATADGD